MSGYGTAQRAANAAVASTGHQARYVLSSGISSSAAATAPDFELSTPLLAMPYEQFKKQGRIYKSIKIWRDKALGEGWLVEYVKASGKIVIFISHTWWDREFKDETNHPDDPYDKGQLLPLHKPRCSSRHPFASRMPVPACH